MTIIDEACWERGCPCHDDGESGGVEVVRKEWVGLTDEDIKEIDTEPYWDSVIIDTEGIGDLARQIEAKLKEKNT